MTDKPTPEAFLKSLQSIERVQANKQPVIRSREKPDHLFQEGHTPWNAK